METVTCSASPSLALVKYWGKKRNGLPATSSLAITLGGLETTTTVSLAEKDSVNINGMEQEVSHFTPFLDRVRSIVHRDIGFDISSQNTFPTAAGLASSSSGFAAMACGCTRAAGQVLTDKQLSELARAGSSSAARSIFGGFVFLPAGSSHARRLFGPEYWPDLTILIAVVEEKAKSISSREAMNLSRNTSPFYKAWVGSSRGLVKEAVTALEHRDLEVLGEAARASYMRMHAAMMAATPPIRYWKPASLAVQDVCAQLRSQGTGAWETMDAGAQVKILCASTDAAKIRNALEEQLPQVSVLESFPGEGVRCSNGS
jgi:diphosphomevalonate decarboxylase